jgi:hypothetical protein
MRDKGVGGGRDKGWRKRQRGMGHSGVLWVLHFYYLSNVNLLFF